MGNRPKGEPPQYRRWARRGEVRGYATYQGGRVVFPGPHNSQESRRAYEQWRAEWVRLNGERPPQPPAGCEVGELILAFLAHAEQYYRRPDGTPTSEFANYKVPLRHLRALYEDRPVNDFGPLDLEAVRDRMVRAGLSRGVCNQYAGRVRRIFVWGCSRGLVRPEVVVALKSLQPLQRGRSVARERPAVLPVEWAAVEATLPFLASDQLRALVLLQWHTGCRPGQACTIRGEDIYQSGVVQLGRKVIPVPALVWLWCRDAKMAHVRGCEDREEIYIIGPRGQLILEKWLRPGYLFSPREASTRLTTPRRERPPGDCYQRTSYSHAVRDALAKARRAGVSVPPWHPHQLRHAVAARVRAAAGLEAARAVLNHRDASLTVQYSERDVALAAETIRRLG